MEASAYILDHLTHAGPLPVLRLGAEARQDVDADEDPGRLELSAAEVDPPHERPALL